MTAISMIGSSTEWRPLTPPPGAPLEERIMLGLAKRLEERAPLIDLYTDYYEGRHRLAFVSSPYRRAFGQMLAGVTDNWCSLVVKAATERLEVQAFKIAGDNPGLEEQAIRFWRRDGLEHDGSLAYTEAAKAGESYMLVQADEDGTARITVEHARQFIVQRSPADRRQIVAALKSWYDEILDEQHYTLWTRAGIYRRSRGRDDQWFVPRAGEVANLPNLLGDVPVAVLVNDPHMLPALPPLSLMLPPHNVPEASVGLGRSDLADVISTQDAIDQLVSGMLLSSEFAAFRQRWATGLEVPRDPETQQPIEPFRAAVDRVWVSEGKDTQFGEFAPTELRNYIEAIEFEIRSIASRTRIPPHILMSGSGNWPSGETLKAAESGLISKVRDKQRSFAPGIARAMALAFRLETGVQVDVADISVDWTEAERRVESEFADALTKKLAIFVPPQQLWEDDGYTPEQIAEFPRLLREAAEFTSVLAPGNAPASPPAEPAPAPPPTIPEVAE